MPFIGRKNGILTARQQLHNDAHRWYSTRIEHLFGPWPLLWTMGPCLAFVVHSGLFAGFLYGREAQRAHSATIWVYGRSRNPYFVVL